MPFNYGKADGSELTLVGRNQTGDDGNPGTYNWSEPEVFTFTMSVEDRLFVAVWNDGGPRMLIGQFERAGQSTLLTNRTTWEGFVANGVNPGVAGDAPALTDLQSEISNGTWATLGAAALNGAAPWGTIAGISANGQFIGTDTLTGSSTSDAHFVLFRSPATQGGDALTAQDASYVTSRDQALSGSLADNVTNPSGSLLTFTASYASTANGQVSVDAAGNFVYTPNPGYYGTDQFSYTVSDGNAETTGTVNLTVDGLSANAAAYLLLHDQGPLAGNLQENIFNPTGGTLTFTPYSGSTVNGQLSVDAAGNFVYTPDDHASGPDGFSYTVSDGMTQTTGTVNLTVDGLTANDASYITLHDQPLSGTLAATVTNPSGNGLTFTPATSSTTNGQVTVDAAGNFVYTPNSGYYGPDSLTYYVSNGSFQTIGTVNLLVDGLNAGTATYLIPHDQTLSGNLQGSVFNPTTGTLTFTAPSPNTPNGQVSVNAAGNFVYTPNSGFYGSDNFSYNVSDGIAQTAGTVTITVDGLAANDASYITLHDQPLSGNLAATVENPSGHALGFSSPNSTAANGQVSVDVSGNFVYTPNLGYYGPDRFTYFVSDGDETIGLTVNILVDGLNAYPATYLILYDQPLSGNLQQPVELVFFSACRFRQIPPES